MPGEASPQQVNVSRKQGSPENLPARGRQIDEDIRRPYRADGHRGTNGSLADAERPLGNVHRAVLPDCPIAINPVNVSRGSYIQLLVRFLDPERRLCGIAYS